MVRGRLAEFWAEAGLRELLPIISCSLSFILQFLFSEILLPFPFSFLLSLPLLISKITPPFSFLLPMLVSKIASPFSVSFLFSLALLLSAVSSPISSSLPLSLIEICLLAAYFLFFSTSLSLSLYSRLEDIINKTFRKCACKNYFRQPIRKISFCCDLTSLNFQFVFVHKKTDCYSPK